MANLVNNNLSLRKHYEEGFSLISVLESEDVLNLFDVIETASSTIVHYPLGILEGILRAGSNSCDRTTVDGLEFNEREFSLCPVELSIDQCPQAWVGTAAEYFIRNNGAQDELGAYVEGVILQRVEEGMKADLIVIALFGDTTSENELVSICDGLFKKLIEANYEIQQYNWTPSEDADDRSAIETLREMYDNASRLMFASGVNMRIEVSRRFYTKYKNEIQDNCCDGAGIEKLQNGSTGYFFEGIEVKVNRNWDAWKAKYGITNFIDVLMFGESTEKNFVLGTDSLNASFGFDAIVNPYAKNKLQIDANFKMGVDWRHPELVVIAGQDLVDNNLDIDA